MADESGKSQSERELPGATTYPSLPPNLPSDTMTFVPDLSGTCTGMMGQPIPEGAKKVHQLSAEMVAMREYALGEDGRSRCDGTVLLHVSHSNLKKTFFHELRLDMHSSIEAVKRKLEFHTGTSAVTNQVEIPPPCGANVFPYS